MGWYLTTIDSSDYTAWELDTENLQSVKASGAPEDMLIDPEDVDLTPSEVESDDEGWTIESEPTD